MREDNVPSNKSMDVRAKQRLCYQRRLLTFSLRVGGFAPRHLKRSMLSRVKHEGSLKCGELNINK